MPGVNSKGEPMQSYGYDIGGGTQSIKDQERGMNYPKPGLTGKIDELNENRFSMKKDPGDGPAKSYTPDNTKPFDARGYKTSKASDSQGWLAEHKKRTGAV